MELRYIGENPISFLAPPVGELQPGDTFDLEDIDQVRAFFSRRDIELVNPEDAEALEEPSEDTEETPAAESPDTGSEGEETPTEVQGEAAPASAPTPRKKAATKTDSSGSADATAK